MLGRSAMDVRIESFDPNGQKSVRECRFTEVQFSFSFHWVVSCSKQGLKGNKTKLNEVDAVLFQTNPWVYSCIHRHVHIRLWTTCLRHLICIYIYIYTCVSMKRWHQQLELLASLGHDKFSFDISFNSQVSSACAHNFVRPTTFRPTQQFQMASANTVFHRWHVPPYHFSF